MSKAKKKLAEQWGNQISGVEFSDKSEIDKFESDAEFRQNYLTNLLHLGWAITNMTSAMKKAYNWHGLDGYRFVPIGDWPVENKKVTNGLLASTKKGFTRRNVKRKISTVATRFKKKTCIKDEQDSINASAAKQKELQEEDTERLNTTGKTLYQIRKEILHRASMINDLRGLQAINGTNELYESILPKPEIKPTQKQTTKSLIELVQKQYTDLDDKWKGYCARFREGMVKYEKMKQEEYSNSFYDWFLERPPIWKKKLAKHKEGENSFEDKVQRAYKYIKSYPDNFCVLATDLGFTCDCRPEEQLLTEERRGERRNLKGTLLTWRYQLRCLADPNGAGRSQKPDAKWPRSGRCLSSAPRADELGDVPD